MCGSLPAPMPMKPQPAGPTKPMAYGKSGKDQGGYGVREQQDYDYLPQETGTYLHISLDMNDAQQVHGYAGESVMLLLWGD